MTNDLFTTQYNPDVLSCLANLSNDEVFTPPEIVNQMLDMLPPELFKNLNTKFLDPTCKSGVFLREIAKRLLVGLERKIPDLQERIDHIFKNQVYGIAITELTSLLSRRSVYCSKYPNSIYSVSPFDKPSGNVRFKKIKHKWKREICIFCGASQSQYDRGDLLETHAYELIHTTKPEEIFKMKFDVIIGNPPYQLGDGGHGDSAKPIYNLFIEQAKKLNPRYLSMIIPARWYAGGKGLDAFRKNMLRDNRIQILHDFPETKDCFVGINIRGGVCYFLWNRDYHGDCLIVNHKDDTEDKKKRPLLEQKSDTFIRYNSAISILRKVQKFNEPTMESLVSSRKPFGLATNFDGFKSKSIGNKSIKLYRNGETGFISPDEIEKNKDLVNKIKVLVAKASPGSDEYPHLVFSEPIISDVNSICTETYLIVSVVDSIEQGENFKRYMSTKFFRFMVLLIKNTQDVPKKVYRYVPIQDLDVIWTDDMLFEKYDIHESEIEFINRLVKEVEWRPAK
jgi:site-specific DNA-methyltransferase (adenine-specific)